MANSELQFSGSITASNLNTLLDIQQKNPPSDVYLFFADNVYDINVKERSIKGPSTLSVKADHKAEVIYFRIDRFVDYMDLSNTVCVIEYVLPQDVNRVPYYYVVPFYDTSKFLEDNKMIFPWVVGAQATKKSGTLEYTIRFFKVEGEGEKAILDYSLSFSPAYTQVLSGLNVNEEALGEEYDTPLASAYEDLVFQLKNNQTHWTVLD